MTGTIIRIQDHGTIVVVWVATSPSELAEGVGTPVHFDHSPFRWMLDAEGDGTVESLIGREVEVTDRAEPGQTIRFDEPQSFYDAGAPAGIDQRGSIT